jgi:hypothetical protein
MATRSVTAQPRSDRKDHAEKVCRNRLRCHGQSVAELTLSNLSNFGHSVTIHRLPRRGGWVGRVCQANVNELATLSLGRLSPRSPRVSVLQELFPDGAARKELPVPKPFRRSAPNVESDAASAPACWTRDIRTDANPRPA